MKPNKQEEERKHLVIFGNGPRILGSKSYKAYKSSVIGKYSQEFTITDNLPPKP